MKLTLLDITQTILSSLDSDEVDSISDTTESLQVANIVKQAYFNIIARSNLPEHYQLINLDASIDPDTPVLMTNPENVLKIDWLKYDIQDDPLIVDEPNYAYITILPIKQFLEMVHALPVSESYVDSMTINGNLFYFRNDKTPSYCTILEDSLFIFDSYDVTVDSTLQSSKTLAFAKVSPGFTMEDSFIPVLDEMQFPLLLNEAKSLAFLELKQIAHDQAVREARLQWQSSQHSKYLKGEHPFHRLPNFGRARPRAAGLRNAIQL